MRTVRGISFAELIAAGTVGAYFSAVVAGLLAVITGQAFAGGSLWLAGAGVLALFGAVGGWLLAGITRARLVPKMSRRTLAFALGGLVSLPLAVAVGQLHQVGGVGIVMVVLAGLVGIIRYLRRRLRRASQRFDQQYARAAR
jgi:hypothetical protein